IKEIAYSVIHIFDRQSSSFIRAEKIKIDLKHKDYQILSYDRYIALQRGRLLGDQRNYVPAVLTLNNNKYDAKIRLKGHGWDHWNEEKKWSFRIKLKNKKTIFGMNEFSINHPKTRGFLNEYLFHEFLRKEGFLSLRFDFIEVNLNGNSLGAYAIEEGMSKILIEHNKFREGPILKFNDDLNWKAAKANLLDLNENYLKSSIDVFENSEIEKNTDKYKNFLVSKDLINSFRNGDLTTSDVFNVKKLAKLFALTDLFGFHHATAFTNIRFYYNPITSKLEPIGYDQTVIKKLNENGLYIEHNQNKNFQKLWSNIFLDKKFIEEYYMALNLFSNKNYLDTFLEDINNDLLLKKQIINKSYPLYEFKGQEILYNNQNYIRKILNPEKVISVHLNKIEDNKISLSLANLQVIPIKVLSVSFGLDTLEPLTPHYIEGRKKGSKLNYDDISFLINDTQLAKYNTISNQKISLKYKLITSENSYFEEAKAWPFITSDFPEARLFKSSDKLFNFKCFEKVNSEKKIYIKPGSWIIDKPIHIPKNFTLVCGSKTRINLINSSFITSSSPISFIGGNIEDNEHIIIESTDSSGQGLFLFNAKDTSFLKNIEIKNLKSPSKGRWNLYGVLNFYESDVQIVNCVLKNNHSEDGINIIRSNFKIEMCLFENIYSDAIDLDFSSGSIINSNFLNCSNDAIDFSGSISQISDLRITNSGDKGISAGERSVLSIKNVIINNSNIAIASKDDSEVTIQNIKISECNIGLTAFQKKAEYGPAIIRSKNIVLNDTKKSYLIEKGSFLYLDNKIIDGKDVNLKKQLYNN
ncbi:MAG: right-handed parallel beta-helix repeat-containing protein, partial [Candidatus Neomarinimicrobiota bacterium]